MKALMKQAVILVLGGYFIYVGFLPKGWSFIDGANLLIHEGGHFIFGYFGEYIGLWGGTLMQLLFPLMLAFHFFKRKDSFSFYVMLVWFGQNFFNIAPYIKDARARVLPLTTGNIYDAILGTPVTGHDWNSILGRAGLLELDQFIGNAVWFTGLVVILTSVCLGIRSVSAEKNNPEAEA
jgi:hypothetical protein